MELITIIMPAYNCEKTILKTINSVLKQTYQEFELIIINDGSTDETRKICEKIKDKRIRLINKQNEGPSSARNTGLCEAKGKYIMFIDADDLYLDSTLETMIKLMNSKDYDIVTGNYVSFNEKKVNKKRYIKFVSFDNKKDNFKYIDYLQKKGLFNTNWNKIYIRRIIEENKIRFDETKAIGEDARFNYEYIRYVNKSSVINDVIYKYYLNEGGLTIKNENTKAERLIKSLEEQLLFYKQEKFPNNALQLRVLKAFFNINNIEFIYKSQYCDMVDKINNKKWYLKCLNKMIKKRKNRKLKLLLMAYKLL